ncbi:MAG: hypothetical protein NTX05_05690 [Fusobacteria bacterium]|nr:hypothetical protein [Fusobacteriota bacterium]
MKQQFSKEYMLSLQNEEKELVSYLVKFLNLQRSVKLDLAMGDYNQIKRETLFSTIDNFFSNDFNELESDLFLSYINQGCENRVHHYSLSQEGTYEEFEENLIKVILKRDKVNVQRYLERLIRLDFDRAIESLLKVCLLDSNWFDLYIEFTALNEWFFKLKKEDRVSVIGYIALLVSSRPLNIISGIKLEKSSLYITPEEMLEGLKNEIQVHHFEETLGGYCFLKSLIQSLKCNRIARVFFDTVYNAFLIKYTFTPKKSITTSDWKFLLERALHE